MVVGDGNVVERRYIEPGPLQEDNTRVVLQGLEPSERYITVGLQRARPGMPVTPKEAAGGILLLASPLASFITGHTLEITGGAGL